MLRGARYFQFDPARIPVGESCRFRVTGGGETETVKKNVCRKIVRFEKYESSGRSNRRPRCGNKPEGYRCGNRYDAGKPTMRYALNRRNPGITEERGISSRRAVSDDPGQTANLNGR